MDKDQFANARVKLGKTQKELAKLLGISLKAVQSYEQGWRTVPLHVERQLYFLIANQRTDIVRKRNCCWNIKKCIDKQDCPAWEFQAGHLCWFISGTQCSCVAGEANKDEMEICRQCPVLTSLL